MRVREDEHEALRLLHKHFPRFGRLEKSERPDWVDYESSLGVEVTQAVNQTVKEQEEYFHKNLKGKSKEAICPQSISRVEKCGLAIVSIKNGEQENTERMYGLVRVFGVEEKELLRKAICSKYAKQYQKLESIDLYVFFRHMCRGAFAETDFNALLQTAHDCEIKYGKVFKKIMIDLYSVLIILDLEHDRVEEVMNYGD